MKRSSFLPFMACAALGLSSGTFALAGTQVIDNPGAGGNRIEVTGNHAGNVRVRCADEGRGPAPRAADVNSVNVDGRALQGRTIIVTGRNTRGPDTRVDCPKGQHDGGARVNVNSVNIR